MLKKRDKSILQSYYEDSSNLQGGHAAGVYVPGDEKEVAEFVSISREMARLGEPGWRAAMDAYMNQLEKFQTAVADGNLQSAGDAFKELLNCKISCHKEFR